MMHRCGVKNDHARLDAAYEVPEKGTVPNGDVWYGGALGGETNLSPQASNR
jgi:hypothetical protein